MGLVFQRKQKEEILNASVSSSKTVKQLTHENILFLKQLGFQVKK